MESRRLCARGAAGAWRPATGHEQWRRPMTQTALIQVPRRVRNLALSLLAVGVVTAIYGVIVVPQRTWPNLLLSGFYITSAGVSAMCFLATHRPTGARWSACLQKNTEEFLPR